MIGYYFITDADLSRQGIFSDTRAALASGVKFVQYRAKDLSSRQMYIEASKLRKICKQARFLINDRLDIALSVGADGLHLGQEDLAYKAARKLLGRKKIIGITVHSLKEAQEAQGLGADYLGVSPIFTTRTKGDAGPAKGIALIKKIKEKVALPLVAIGGINLANARQVIQAGADGICAISAVVTAADVGREIKKFQALFR